MTTWRIKLLERVAGRIPVEKVSAQTYAVLNLVNTFLDSKRQWDIRPGQKEKIGTINLPFRDKTITVDVIVVSDRALSFIAGADWNKDINSNPLLVINIISFLNRDYWYLKDKLKPLIDHELTHLLDMAYNPVYSHQFQPGEIESAFFKEFQSLFIDNSPNIDYGNLASFNNQEILTVARNHTIRFLKSKVFKDLATKYGVQLDKAMVGKLLRVIYDMYITDMNHYRDTGGDMFGLSQTKEDKEKTKNIQQVGEHLYFNSESEMKAYINQIISEVDHYLSGDPTGLAIKFMRKEESISGNLDFLLSKSKTFTQNKASWTDKNLKRIYKELANFLAKTYTRLSNIERANILDIKMTPEEDFMYRYINKLHKNNPDKLMLLMQDEEFRKKNINALLLLKHDLDFADSLKKLRESAPEFFKK